MKPIPDNVKACLAELSASQQVTLKGYIATLRAELKEAEEQLRTAHDPDPHAHFHGDEKCTLDHGHDKEGDAHHHGKEEHDDCCGGHDEDHHKHDHHEHGHSHGKEEEEDSHASKKQAVEKSSAPDPMDMNWNTKEE